MQKDTTMPRWLESLLTARLRHIVVASVVAQTLLLALPANAQLGPKAGPLPGGGSSSSQRSRGVQRSVRGLDEGDEGVGRKFFVASGPRKRYGICIGINGYKPKPKSPYHPLKYAGNDAISLASVLLENCGFDHVLLMTDAPVDAALTTKFPRPRLEVIHDVTRNSIRDRGEEFFSQASGKDDLIAFFFAGHADANPDAALIAVDYDGERPLMTALAIDQVFHWGASSLDGAIGAGSRLYLFDACRSGPGHDEFHLPIHLRAELARPRNRTVVLSACDADKKAWEDDTIQHGLFSYAVIEALKGSAFRENQSTLTVDDVCNYVDQKFRDEHWDARQQPVRLSVQPGMGPFVLQVRAVTALSQSDEVTITLVANSHALAVDKYVRNSLDDASQQYDICITALTKAPTLTAKQRLYLGRLYAEHACVLFRKNDRQQAELAKAKALMLVSEDAALHELAGYEYLNRRLSKEAADELRLALQGREEAAVGPHVLVEFGVALYLTDRFHEAGEVLLKASRRCQQIRLNDDVRPILFRAALCFAKANEHKRACDIFLQVEGPKSEAHDQKLRELDPILEKIAAPR